MTAQRRNRRSSVEDRWVIARGPDKGKPTTRHGKGLRYMARTVTPQGKEVTRSFATRKEASTWLRETDAKIETDTYIDPKFGAVTFASFYREWSKTRDWRHQTHRAMDLAVRSVPFGDTPLAEIDEAVVMRWYLDMRDAGVLAPGTVRNRVACIRMVFNAARKARRIAVDPTAEIKAPQAEKRTRVLSATEVRALLDGADDRFMAFIAVGAFAGLRLGEVAALQVADIRFLDQEIDVVRQVQRGAGSRVIVSRPKSGTGRVVFAAPGLLHILAEHIRVHCPGDDPHRWLFPGADGNPMHQNSAGHLWRRARDAAGLSWSPRFHDTRHHYASGLIAAGCDVVMVQRAMGHHSPRVTLDVYAHQWAGANDRTRAAANGLLDAVLQAPADSPRTVGEK